MPEPEEVERPTVGPAERELADALAGLQPAPVRTTQRDVWFRAGVDAATAAGRRSANRWRAVAGTALASLVACGGALLAARTGRPPTVVDVERVVYVERAPAPAAPATTAGAARPAPPDLPAPPAEPSAYLRLRDAVVGQGLAGLPPLRTAGDGGACPPGRTPAGSSGRLNWSTDMTAPDEDGRG